MSLFKCTKCNCLDNTAVSSYWQRQEKGEPVLCTECQGNEWHNRFPKRHMSETNYRIAEDGFLYNPDNPPAHSKLKFNESVLQTFRDTEAEKNLVYHESVEAMYKEWGI